MTRTPLQTKNFRVGDMPDQSGRTVLITGANNGLGLKAATALAGAGAANHPGVPQSDDRTGTPSAACARRAPKPNTALLPSILPISVTSAKRPPPRSSWRRGSTRWINNAGLMAVPFARTADGFEMQIGTNHLGHFAFTDGVLPALLAAPEPRVVSLASIAHRQGRIVLDDLNFQRRRYHRMTAIPAVQTRQPTVRVGAGAAAARPRVLP